MKTILFSRYYDQRIKGHFYNEMRYINLRFTYLLSRQRKGSVCTYGGDHFLGQVRADHSSHGRLTGRRRVVTESGGVR